MPAILRMVVVVAGAISQVAPRSTMDVSYETKLRIMFSALMSARTNPDSKQSQTVLTMRFPQERTPTPVIGGYATSPG